MNTMVVRGLVVLVFALALAGCQTKESLTKTDEAPVDDLAAADAAARAHGVTGAEGFRGSALDDPDSPLSIRVIYFEFDSDEVKPEYRSAVEAHAAYLAANSNTLVTLEGHADERGSREYNLALGERRAMAVRRQMVLLGASAGQVRTVSYGEERPVAFGHDEGSYALNRRVEIIY